MTIKPMRMELIRHIYPAGFGAFHSEFFIDGNGDTFHVVYDCGAKHADGKSNIKDAIRGCWPYYPPGPNRHVDLLFVSHFHEDHINCIKELKIDTRTTVFLPYIFDNNQYLFEHFYQFHYTELLQFLTERECKIVLVAPYNNDNLNLEGNRYVDGELPLIDRDLKGNAPNSQYPVFLPFNYFYKRTFDWVFMPLHLQDKSLYQGFVADVLAAGITPAQLAHYNGSNSKLKRMLKGLYNAYIKKDKHAKGSLNASTMLLASRPITMTKFGMHCFYAPFARWRKKYPCHWDEIFQPHGTIYPGCLYTGDMPLSTPYYLQTLKTVKKKLIPDGAGLVQLPHHGSIEGYSSTLLGTRNLRYVFVNCMEDASSKKHEPVLYAKAIFDCFRKGIPLIAVSEHSDTCCCMHFFKRTLKK